MKVSKAKAPKIRDEEEECSNNREVLNSCLGELRRDVQRAQNTIVDLLVPNSHTEKSQGHKTDLGIMVLFLLLSSLQDVFSL